MLHTHMQHAQYMLLFLVLNSKCYRVTHAYCRRLFLCALGTSVMLHLLLSLQPYIELSVETSNGKTFFTSCSLVSKSFLQLSGSEGKQGVICQCLGLLV